MKAQLETMDGVVKFAMREVKRQTAISEICSGSACGKDRWGAIPF